MIDGLVQVTEWRRWLAVFEDESSEVCRLYSSWRFLIKVWCTFWGLPLNVMKRWFGSMLCTGTKSNYFNACQSRIKYVDVHICVYMYIIYRWSINEECFMLPHCISFSQFSPKFSLFSLNFTSNFIFTMNRQFICCELFINLCIYTYVAIARSVYWLDHGLDVRGVLVRFSAEAGFYFCNCSDSVRELGALPQPLIPRAPRDLSRG